MELVRIFIVLWAAFAYYFVRMKDVAFTERWCSLISRRGNHICRIGKEAALLLLVSIANAPKSKLSSVSPDGHMKPKEGYARDLEILLSA